MGQDPTWPSCGSLESLQSHLSSIQRARPPDVDVYEKEKRHYILRTGPVDVLPMEKSEKSSKRESRVGLRSIFGRSKIGRDGKQVEGGSNIPSSTRERPSGLRASLAEISHRHSSRPELTLTEVVPPLSSRYPSSGLKTYSSMTHLHQPSYSSSKFSQPPPSRSSSVGFGGAGSVWSPPPLFQAYPQAIKHTILPTCVASMDALARLNGSRHSLVTRDESLLESAMLGSTEDAEKKGDWRRRRHGRAGSKMTLEWTNKIYILATSGNLLQYAAEGTYDRPPEKCLQLTKDSAAFASDMIPGKHWVMQVSSTVDADGTPSHDSRSLFQKLALRSSEKRNAPNVLMVFDSAEEMDSWLATVRREIENLGGKKRMSETGKAKVESETDASLRPQISQRTLVVRDPDRFANVSLHDFAWSNKHSPEDQTDQADPVDPVDPNLASELSNPEHTPELTMDDVSTTESHYSSDGLHLDNLRDSSHRLSCISSGQRTFLTSAGSSPACSPTRASFSSNHEDSASFGDNQPEIRPRPNAQAISKRRKSVQVMLPSFEEPASRPLSTISLGNDSPHSSHRQSTPNFSVPVNKRYSGIRSAPLDPVIDVTGASPEPPSPPRSVRKAPPVSLAMSRPLSVVVDQPSPRSPLSVNATVKGVSPEKAQASASSTEQPESPSLLSAWSRHCSSSAIKNRLPSRGSSLAPETMLKPVSQSQTATVLSPSDEESDRFTNRDSSDELDSAGNAPPSRSPRSSLPRIITPGDLSKTRLSEGSPLEATSTPVSTDSSPIRRFSVSFGSKLQIQKRASLRAEDAFCRSPRHSFASLNEEDVPAELGPPPSPPRRSSKRFTQSPHISSSNSLPSTNESRPKALFNRRSMPHLAADGPPPLPPPTCALPPIPKKYQPAATTVDYL